MDTFVFTSSSDLNSFLQGTEHPEFLQSAQWGDIMQSEGEAVIRIGVREGECIVGAATVARKTLAGGLSYLFSPRGPVFLPSADRQRALASLAGYLMQTYPRSLFWRVEPFQAPDGQQAGLAIRKTIDWEPAETLVLDLSQSEDDLLAQMHQKTRYNIRLAEKKGIVVREVDVPDEHDWQEFSRLMSLTGARDGFRTHSLKHYRQMLGQGGGTIRLWFAAYQGDNVAAGIFSFWSGQAGYLHGASDNRFRNLMAPHLLQWTVIRQAKARGQKEYDFYGIDEKKWPGVSRFKLGFGGERRRYAGTYDLVFRPALYNLYGLARRLRRSL